MWYFSGKLSQLIKFTCYSIIGGMMVLRRDDAHRVKVYHGQAYIDCNVDGDNDPNTCLSDFTVLSSFRFNAGYVFGSAFCIAAVLSLVELLKHKQHAYSVIHYYDAIIVNSLITFGIAVICGTQELSTLVLLGLNTFMYEAGIYVHDIGYWNSGTFEGYKHWGRISVLMLLNIITWAVILTGLIEYWSKSNIPKFIPTLGVFGMIHIIMLRIFHYRFFYGTVPGKIVDVSDKEAQKLFDDKPYSTKASQTKYETLVKVKPFVVDWGDSWKNIINLTFRMVIGLVFFVGTNTIKITYR
jgi:magnesium-transporting ATPase (P-type)